MRGKPLTRKSSSVYFHTRTSQTIADVGVYAGIHEGAALQRAQWGVILLWLRLGCFVEFVVGFIGHEFHELTRINTN